MADQPPPIRSELLNLPGYDPVQPLEELARAAGLAPADVLKLDANENPFGPLPVVAETLARFYGYERYPDPLQTRLREAIADYVDVPVERIVVGAGSDELIDLCFRCLVAPGKSILSCPPTFGMYRFSAGLAGIPIVEVERREDFTVDVGVVRAAVTSETALIVLASPNNPTGNALAKGEVEKLLDTGLPLLIDEAYAEFAGASLVSETGRRPQLMVLRTFSKWAGLAGLRMGFGVFPESVAEVLLKAKSPYNVNVAGEAAVLASLEQRAMLEERVRTIVEVRGALFESLRVLPWLEPFPSDANFVLCRVRDGDGIGLKEALAQRGVFVRYFDTPRLRDCVRISVPRPDQSATLLERLAAAGADLGLQ
jgi:histidinol-phosphate aminotransferase